MAEALLQKFLTLHDELNAELVEREREVHAAILALVSGTHVFFLGEPGIAKSLLVDRLVARISDNRHFHILLNNFTGPDAVFGPLDMAALKSGRYRRMTDRYLPWANTVFEDEIWKAGDSILNAHLNAYNERVFDNDGELMEIPLSTAFCASNELPANESLQAIYDRIPQRLALTKIQEAESFITMLGTAYADPVTVLAWADVEAAKKEVSAIEVERSVFEVMWNIRRELDKQNVFPSDRRFKQAIPILQAEAWLDGCDSVTPEHISILQNVLWDRREHIAVVSEVVLQLANPLEKATLELLANIDQIGDELDRALQAQDEDERQRLGIEVHPKVKRASQEYHELAEKAGESRRQQVLLARCKAKLHTHSQTLIKDIFNLEPGDTAAPI